MKGKYDDIIHLPRHVSKKHPQMPVSVRAAQFAPFAALTGHDAAVKEAARLTDERIELDEYIKDALNHKLQIIEERLDEQLEIAISYFKPDGRKKGGSYVRAVGIVKKIDPYKCLVLMTDGRGIPIEEIISISFLG